MLAKQLETNGYAIIRNALAMSSCELLCKRLRQRNQNNSLIYDRQTKKGLVAYGDIIFDKVLEMIQPVLEKRLDRKLLPSFSYGRWYEPNAELLIHRDRDAAELACSMTLDYSGERPWPLYLSDNEQGANAIKVELQKGDMVLFYGGRLWHWRDTLAGQWQMQAIFFYLHNTTKNQALIYDGRSGLGEKAVPL